MARTLTSRRRIVEEFPYSLDFNGASGTEMDIGTAIYQFERTDSFGWAYWLYVREPATTTQIIVGEFASSPFEGWHTRFVGGLLRDWLIGSAGGAQSLRKEYIPPQRGRWTLVETTYDGSSSTSGLKCYYNGVLQTAVNSLNNLSTSMLAADAEMKWGNFVTGSPAFNGKIIPIAVFDYERTATEVADLYYDNEITGTTPLDYYAIDEGSGTNVASTGSAGNDGTLASVTWDANNTPGKLRTVVPQERLIAS